MSSPSLSLILATYNQPRELALVLRTLERQSFQDFEVLIADDGSHAETRQLIEAAAKESFGARLKHVWQEDNGFRKARILNAAIREARAPWLVFSDGDCLLHPRFLEDHFSQRGERTLFCGRRVDVGEAFTKWALSHPQETFSAGFQARLQWSGLTGDTRHANRALRWTSPWLRRLMNYDNLPDLLGSNFSVSRTLLQEVNGFDEAYEGYGLEDGDLFIRLRNSGAQVVGKKCFAIQYHLFHPRRAFKPGAEELYNTRLKSDFSTKRCARGLV